MTTFMLEEIDWSTREIKVGAVCCAALYCIGDNNCCVMKTSVSVCHDMASHPHMLTDKELTSVTASFKSLESGLRGATIKQEVRQYDMSPFPEPVIKFSFSMCTHIIH